MGDLASVDKPEAGLLQSQEMLDRLIKAYYEEFISSIGENVKLGDFLKMIELRHKLAPGETAQKQFWNMLEGIRKQQISGGTSKPEPTGLRKKSGSVSKKSSKTRLSGK